MVIIEFEVSSNEYTPPLNDYSSSFHLSMIYVIDLSLYVVGYICVELSRGHALICMIFMTCMNCVYACMYFLYGLHDLY